MVCCQPRKFSEKITPGTLNRNPKALAKARPAGLKRRSGGPPRPPIHAPDGRGGGAEGHVQENPASDRRAAAKTRSSVGRGNRRSGENDRKAASEWRNFWANGLPNEGRSRKSGHRMAAEGTPSIHFSPPLTLGRSRYCAQIFLAGAAAELIVEWLVSFVPIPLNSFYSFG